jgi:YD repeat-containing protein
MKKRTLVARIAVSLLLVGMLSTPAAPQSGCWSTTGMNGPSSDEFGVPESSGWLELLASAEASSGAGPYNCTYTWIPGNNNDPYGHYYGNCVSQPKWTCSAPPPPPAGAASETGPGPSSCPSCAGGRPINLTNGNTYIQQTDIQIPGIGSALVLQRTWNSIWPSSQSGMISGLFGPNWRSTYEERVFVDIDGTVKYSRSDGSFWSFQLYGSPAVYQTVAPQNTSATLVYGATSWTLSFKNGETRLFDSTSGSLTKIIDRNGNTTQLSYDSSNRLVTVTDPASRHLYFGYGSNSSLLVTAVTSDFGISLTYLYDSQGRLIQLTMPDLTTISFAYNSNSMITAVTDSNGKVLESHTYDSYGRGLTSSKANGVEALTLTYPTQ